MSGGSQLRKEMEARVTSALAERGYRRQKAKERYRRTEGVEAPLQAQLLVSVETDRYGLVRVTGGAEIVSDAVDDAYDAAPEDALSVGQQIYRGRRMHPLAATTFQRLDPDAPQNVPLEWTASDPEQGTRAVDSLLAFVDGPVASWFDGRSTVAGLRAAADEDDHRGRLPEIVRNVAVLEALSGDAAAARDRVERYAGAPSDKGDSPEQVRSFLRWLATVPPSAAD